MKAPTLVILSEVIPEAEELEESLLEKGVSVLSTSKIKKLMEFVRTRNIVVVVAYDNIVEKFKLGLSELLELLYSDLKPNILFVGNPMLYRLEKELHISAIIDRDASVEEKAEEIHVNWQAELILIEEHARLTGMREEEEVMKRMEEELQLRDRKLSTLFIELSEYRKKFNELYKTWMNLGLNRENEKLREFHHLLKNVTQDNLQAAESYEHFIEVGEEFYEELKGMSSKLTQDNLRLCAYLKMGLSNKEIAERMNIQHESVKRTQSRLKDTLGLPKDVTLRKFIQSL